MSGSRGDVVPGFYISSTESSGMDSMVQVACISGSANLQRLARARKMGLKHSCGRGTRRHRSPGRSRQSSGPRPQRGRGMRRYGSFDATCIRYAGSVCKLIGTTCWNISGASQHKTPGLKSGFTMTFEPGHSSPATKGLLEPASMKLYLVLDKTQSGLH